MNHFTAMGRALELAWRGWGRVAPNPLVGAVVLQGDQVVGEGWHAEYGDLHAEAMALRAAGEAARGGTVVVTLEPCNHTGKQPPCTEALIAAGVRCVVAATPDPNPIASGGMERLRAAGIEVIVGVRAEEAQAQNKIFLENLRNPDRPFIGLKLATTLDARIADQAGRSRWISGDEARDYVHWLRAGFDAIAVGAHTATVDDASLTVRGDLVPRRAPVRVVFSRQGDIASSLSLVRSAKDIPTILVTESHRPTSRLAQLEESGVEVLWVSSLPEGLGLLRQRGIGSLLVEGGGRLAGALLKEGLVDRYYWIQSPVWLGDEGIPAVQGFPGTSLVEADRWQVVERRALGQDTLLVVDREPCLPES